MRVFAAGLFNEANGLVATPAVPGDFEAGGLWRADSERPPKASSATVPVERWVKIAAARGDTLVRGLVAYAQPGGRLLRSLYEALRDEILSDLRQAMPLDAVLLSMHGSMIAGGYDDPEGDLIQRIRAIVGAAPIGVELDLHCNVTALMVENATVIVPYKEWPHIDIAERAVEVYELVAGCIEGRLKPVTAVRDCRIVGTFPTQREPMRAFVDAMTAAESQDGVLSVSLAHGFPWGATADMSAKAIVITNDDPNLAATLAERTARDFWRIREAAIERPEFTMDEAIDYGLAATARPIVFGDPADSLGGGNPCDSTFLLARVVERGIGDVAFGPIYDPFAVQACTNVGEGETLRLRIGGKVEPLSGQPVDLEVEVIAIRDHCTQTLDYPGSPTLPMGRVVWVKAPGDIDILLTRERIRTLSSTLFSEMGCDISGKKMVFCKMWRHGVPGFEKVAAEIHFVGCPGGNNLDYASIAHPAALGPYWPKVEDPFVGSASPSLA